MVPETIQSLREQGAAHCLLNCEPENERHTEFCKGFASCLRQVLALLPAGAVVLVPADRERIANLISDIRIARYAGTRPPHVSTEGDFSNYIFDAVLRALAKGGD